MNQVFYFQSVKRNVYFNFLIKKVYLLQQSKEKKDRVQIRFFLNRKAVTKFFNLLRMHSNKYKKIGSGAAVCWQQQRNIRHEWRISFVNVLYFSRAPFFSCFTKKCRLQKLHLLIIRSPKMHNCSKFSFFST